MNAEWNIRACAATCIRCQRPFADKEMLSSRLRFTPEGYLRDDFCAACWPQRGQPDEEALLKAARLAAYFSKGRNHPAQRVDITQRKYVKKSAGAPAGFVTYTHFRTLTIGLSHELMVQIAAEAQQG